VTLVEQDRRTAALIAANARALGFGRVDVLTSAVAGTLRRPPTAPYDIAFLDPPYPLSDAAVAEDLQALAGQGWLVPGAMVVVERSVRSPQPEWPEGITGTREKKYGETVLWYGHAAATDAERAPGEHPDDL
jgi:16S rRNA (guanine966-N2)-methyltransferase